MKKMLKEQLLILIFTTISVIYAPVLQSSEFSIGFSSSEYNTYYDALSSTLEWDFLSEYLYLPYYEGEENILQDNYPGGNIDIIAPPQSSGQDKGTQSGYTFFSKVDCFISGVSRYTSSNGGNSIVRLWTDDAEENSSGISNSWLPSLSCGQEPFWAGVPVDFLVQNYPLTKNNTYWIANLHDKNSAHKIGSIPGSPYSSWTDGIKIVDYWYLLIQGMAPSAANRQDSKPYLYGVADLWLRRFMLSGSLTTKVIDFGAEKVDIKNFEVSFETANTKSSFNKFEKTGSMAYNVRYATITALGRTRVCAASFEISESSDNVNFSEFKTDFTDIHMRYIKLKMNLETQHRGITPLIDDVKITYNAYPEKISTGSINISPSAMTFGYEILVTSSEPRFSWPASYDFDGDEITYYFVLSDTDTFSTVVFSESVTSVPSSTQVAVVCSEVLEDRVVYYFKIDILDEQGASVPFGSAVRFETELANFLCTATGVSNAERVLPSQIQSGIAFTFTKEISTESVKNAVELLDGENNSISYSVTAISQKQFSIVPSVTIKPCQRYTIKVSTALKDSLRGLPLSTSVSINFLTLSDNDSQYTAELSGARVVLPVGSISEPYFLEVSQYEIAVDTQLSAANAAAIGSAFVIPVSTDVFLIDITDINGADITSISGASLSLPFYKDSVDVEGVSVSLKDKLRVFMLDENTNQWVLVLGKQVPASSYSSPKKLSGGSVTANLSGGKFALLAYPESLATNVQLRNVPNPFYLGQETKVVSGLFSIMEIKNVEVQIYTLIGHLIYEKKYSSSELGDIKWDGKNKDGAYVGSGIYILKAKINTTAGSSEVVTRKIGFIR